MVSGSASEKIARNVENEYDHSYHEHNWENGEHHKAKFGWAVDVIGMLHSPQAAIK
jgi:hypothetical protein